LPSSGRPAIAKHRCLFRRKRWIGSSGRSGLLFLLVRQRRRGAERVRVRAVHGLQRDDQGRERTVDAEWIVLLPEL
jgi:hypothetical protein